MSGLDQVQEEFMSLGVREVSSSYKDRAESRSSHRLQEAHSGCTRAPSLLGSLLEIVREPVPKHSTYEAMLLFIVALMRIRTTAMEVFLVRRHSENTDSWVACCPMPKSAWGEAPNQKRKEEALSRGLRVYDCTIRGTALQMG